MDFDAQMVALLMSSEVQSHERDHEPITAILA
jgi:hypothetical protein